MLVDGRIVKSGGKELALELEEKGYDWVEAAGGDRGGPAAAQATAFPAEVVRWRDGSSNPSAPGCRRRSRRGSDPAHGGASPRFETLGFPTTRQEDWRFTNVAAIARTEFDRPPATASVADPARAGHAGLRRRLRAAARVRQRPLRAGALLARRPRTACTCAACRDVLSRSRSSSSRISAATPAATEHARSSR